MLAFYDKLAKGNSDIPLQAKNPGGPILSPGFFYSFFKVVYAFGLAAKTIICQAACKCNKLSHLPQQIRSMK